MDLRKTEKYDRIIDSAVSIFLQKGFHATTVEEIAKEAEVGKGTIYTYFENKNKLFDAIIDGGIENFVSFVDEKVDPQASPKEQLLQALAAQIEYFSQNKEICIFVIRELFDYRASLNEQVYNFYHRHSVLFEGILREGQKQGIFKIDDVSTVAAGLIGAVFSASFYWLIFKEEFPIEQLQKNLLELFFSNIFS